MNGRRTIRRWLACIGLALALAFCALFACNTPEGQDVPQGDDTSGYLIAVEEEPDTVDFQRTTIYYTITTNVFDRLVEMKVEDEDSISIIPSLAESWSVSADGRSYTFRLRGGVTFSNGSPLTASDVYYTFTRLLTFPGTCNREIAENIVGAKQLEAGLADRLEGFRVLNDLEFTITLEQPFEAFLPYLTAPGASIMDEQSALQAGERFGMEPETTVGTGSFILVGWEPGKGMLLKANANCWKGAPKSAGLDLRFMTEPEEIRELFEAGGLDILDLDDIGSYGEFFIHGDIYQKRLLSVPRIGINYIALNNSIAPLDDVRVRKALQLSLDRRTLLNAVYDGMGSVENGIYPHGLYGFNQELEEIPYSPDTARALLREAGLEDGFELTVSVRSSSPQLEMTLMRIAASMWEKIGVKTEIRVMDESEFMRLRKSGALACYMAAWMADFDDPDNFIYTFFGNPDNTAFRSICYSREDVMERIQHARVIQDHVMRIAEYRELERIIVQDDAAWIPLFSRLRVYVMSERVEGVSFAWNGSVKNLYCDITVKETP